MILNLFYDPVITVLVLLTMLAHEMGHWLVAKLLYLDPWLPIFIPLGLITIGLTNIRKLSNIPQGKYILYLAGFITSSILLLTFLSIPSIAIPFLTTTLYLIAYEVMNITIGIDGSRIRETYKKNRANKGNKKTLINI